MTYDDWKADVANREGSAPQDEPDEDPHLAGCTGNGSESCWHCGGEGWVERAFSDDPYDVDTIRCYVCDGEGDIRCPGCEAMLPPDEVSG